MVIFRGSRCSWGQMSGHDRRGRNKLGACGSLSGRRHSVVAVELCRSHARSRRR